jgi:glycosyltransferase involved in cell wall biosynthesis
MAREIWNLPKDKKLILFGAMNATSDINKGFKELQDSISKLTINVNEVELVVFGSSKPATSQGFGFKTHYLGYVYDDVSLTALFSAADVMVVPSIQENLSNSIMESLSCSTPVVGFNIGGNSDMIVHKETGYLANPYDINDLASGIDWILGSKSYLKIAQASREKILKEFDSVIVAQKYIDLYQEVIKNEQRDSSLV